MNADERRLNEITEAIIASAYAVANTSGCGFLEKIYENAMLIELTQRGLNAQQQRGIVVRCRNAVVGEYLADLLVEESVVVEIKAAKALDDVHMAQCLNYLKATGPRVCLLINFSKPRIEIRRVVNHF